MTVDKLKKLVIWNELQQWSVNDIANNCWISCIDSVSSFQELFSNSFSIGQQNRDIKDAERLSSVKSLLFRLKYGSLRALSKDFMFSWDCTRVPWKYFIEIADKKAPSKYENPNTFTFCDRFNQCLIMHDTVSTVEKALQLKVWSYRISLALKTMAAWLFKT